MGRCAWLCSQYTLTLPRGNENTAEPGQDDFWHLELGEMNNMRRYLGAATGQTENIKIGIDSLEEQE